MRRPLPQALAPCIAPSGMDEPAPRTSRPRLLVGMPGSGKSTIGPLLAERLGLPFQDSDAMIEARLGMSIAQVFDRQGEASFRAEEKRLLAGLIGGPPAVIAAGGGAFLDPQTRAAALERAIPVWLDAPLAILATRFSAAADRPLLAGRDRLAGMKAARDPIYALASVRVDAARPAAEVAAAIAAVLTEAAQ